MPGHGIGQRPAFGLPNAPGRHAREQHHRLGVGGQGQRLFGALGNQCAQVFAQGIRGLLHGLAHGRVVAPGIQHADGLRALARKDKSKFFHRLKFLIKQGSNAYQ